VPSLLAVLVEIAAYCFDIIDCRLTRSVYDTLTLQARVPSLRKPTISTQVAIRILICVVPNTAESMSLL